MVWSYPGVSYPVEMQYTQTRGVHPDVIAMKFLPQLTTVPTIGTLTMSWDVTITLPNCLVDTMSMQMHPDGVHQVIAAWDRRWLWAMAEPITGYYNIRRAGADVSSTTKNLRQLVTILLNAMGEASPSVSDVPATVYPQVRWFCDPPHIVLEELMKEHHLDLCLGFGSEAVTVVQTGTGANLPTGNEFMDTLTIDPRQRPRWIRTCFGPTRVQARFELEAVGLTEDGSSWELIDDLPYAPAGTRWEREDPYQMPTVFEVSGAAAHDRAISTVFRAYRIVRFANGSLAVPGGLGTLGSIEDILPLINKTLQTEQARTGGSYKPFRVFGQHQRVVRQKGQPDILEDTPVGFELTHYTTHLDTENGIILFDDPVFRIVSDNFVPANLFLEVSFEIMDEDTFAPQSLHVDTSVDTSGLGYMVLRKFDAFRRVIANYDTDHFLLGVTDNESDLETLADAEAAVVAASLTASLSGVKMYSIPKLAIRLDGAINQVRHVLTNGEGRDPVNRTIAGRFSEFDRKVPSQSRRFSHAQGKERGSTRRVKSSKEKKRDSSDE